MMGAIAMIKKLDPRAWWLMGGLALLCVAPSTKPPVDARQAMISNPNPQPVLLNGATTPPAPMGAAGDFYIDTAAPMDIYGPKSGAGWGSGYSLKGPQGNSGGAGSNGTNGTNGSAATIAVGTVTGLAVGASPTIVNGGTSGAAVFNFGLPVGATGATGPAGLGTVTPAPTARTLGVAFRPSTTKAVWVSYTIRTQVTNPLLAGTSSAEVVLYSDAATTPTVERGRVGASSGVGLAVAIALTTANTATVSFIVPAGWYVLLTSNVSGTGSASIISQVEVTLG